MQTEALATIRAWGFQPPTTELVWVKKTVNGNRWFGMGRITRAEHEICLIAKRGRPQVKAKNVRTVFEAINYRHSEKPEKTYEIIESLYDGPYIELFARDIAKPRPGWTYYGDQIR
jgi:N6-adenosine-specific RNA methylase IME4